MLAGAHQMPQISAQSIDQMMVNHRDFLAYMERFKKLLSEQQGSTNLKYLLCRLDFNEYYHVKAIKEEEEKKRAALNGRTGGRGPGAGDDYMFDDGFDYDQEDEEDGDEDGDDDDEDEDEGDDDEDDEDDEEEYGGENSNAHQMQSRAGY